jgi:hypothetical protein
VRGDEGKQIGGPSFQGRFLVNPGFVITRVGIESLGHGHKGDTGVHAMVGMFDTGSQQLMIQQRVSAVVARLTLAGGHISVTGCVVQVSRAKPRLMDILSRIAQVTGFIQKKQFVTVWGKPVALRATSLGPPLGSRLRCAADLK